MMRTTSVIRTRVALAALALAMTAASALLLSASSPAATLPTGFRDSLVVGGMNFPIGFAFLPDGRALVIEQKTANIRMVRNGAFGSPNPVFTVPNVDFDGQERGLLGIAVDPGWPARPYIYLHLNDLNTETLRITRYTVAGDLSNTTNGNLTIDTNTRRDIVTGIPDQFENHNGGTLRFGTDGFLYGSFGDDATRCPAQDKVSMRGVILRLDVSGVPAGGGSEPSRASIAAAGNPMINAADDRSKLIWAWGLRNPFRFIIDSGTNALFISDVGENNWEEVDRAASGGLNFGWPIHEAFANMDDNCALSSTETTPIYAYNHSEGVVVIAAGVYRAPSGGCYGCFGDDYVGDFFFSDYYTGIMRRLVGNGSSWSLAPQVAGQPSAENWAEGMLYVADYAFSKTGSLWYLYQGTSNGAGQLRAILGPVGADTTTPPPPPPPTPQTLAFATPYPQPASGLVNFPITLANAARVKLRIYDLRGRLVRTLVDGERSSGSRNETWDGRDDDGEDVVSGLYVARVEAAGRTAERRVMLVR